MNTKHWFFIFAVIACAVIAVVLAVNPEEEPGTLSTRYLDKNRPIAERVDDLIAQMTLYEKVGQMTLVEKNSIAELEDISRYGIGAILSGAGAKPENNTAEGWREMVASFDQESRQSRLAIPILYGIDANHGHGNVPGATIFPHAIGLGATNNPVLVEKVARATAEEMAATGIYWNFSPSLDLPEDIRWGRTYETFGSDPALVAKLGAAYVKGLQSTKTSVMSTAKHYVGLGSLQWNSSSNPDFKIDQGWIEANESKLRDFYLPPFKSAVEAGAMSVMVGIGDYGDTTLSANDYLINDVLKGELQFDGFVVSDWYGVYEISNSDFLDSITAINAGIDMVMLPFEYKEFVRNVSLAVRLGLIKEDRIDDAVRRILTAKFKLGLFDQREVTSTEIIGSEEHRDLARLAVARSMVLLKDNQKILPLRNIRTIKVAGSAADNVGQQSGAWTVEWQGIDGNWLPGSTSILAGLQTEARKEGVVLEYEKNGDFSSGSAKADVGIAIVGEKPYAEGWGDNADPKLSEEDLVTIEKLRSASKRLVVVLVTGRPLLITEELPKWDALVVAWLPGSEGAGFSDILFGLEPISGTLPIDWPRALSQMPISSDSKTADGTVPLFPRGFGLRK